MKRAMTLMLAAAATVAAMAQTLNVVEGSVTWQFPAADAGQMTFDDEGSSITIAGKTFSIGALTRIFVDDSAVEQNTVTVAYAGATAQVCVAGNIARYVSPAVSAAHVTLTQSDSVGDDTCGEITYSLSGASTDGGFTLEGSYKATVELRGLTLTNPSGPAINVLDGKRIDISVKAGTVNSLADGAGGSHKGCLYVKGHAEFKGRGTLNVSGKTAHAIFTKEYMEMKNCTINVLEAAKDGVNCNQYFYMESGTLNIGGAADDGLQVSFEEELAADRDEEDTGTLTVAGGTLTVTSGAQDVKGLKAEGNMELLGGDITVTMTGAGGKGIKVDGTYTQGLADGSGPSLVVSTSGSAAGGSTGGGGGHGGGWGPGGGGWGPGGGTTGGSGSAKGIKVLGAATLLGGTTEVSTKTSGAEGLESKTSIDIRGGQHYFACYDDCINTSGQLLFNGGVTVCYSSGNDAIDSNYGRTGAITIGDGTVFAYTTKGAPEEGIDCDNNSYIQITGTGIAISAGANQGGGGGGWGGSSSGYTISNARQGYAFVTSTISYAAGRFYTLADAAGNNLVTYSFPAACSSSLALFTATGMVKGSTYNVKYSTSAPSDATTAWHGLYLGSSHKGTGSVTSFTAK